MMSKAYYLTKLGAWQRHAARFVHSHWLALDAPAAGDAAVPGPEFVAAAFRPAASDDTRLKASATTVLPGDATPILVLIEADEGAHLTLEDDPAFEALPHPLAQKPISQAAQEVLAPHGVGPGATTFEAADTLARLHPLLRHRVF